MFLCLQHHFNSVSAVMWLLTCLQTSGSNSGNGNGNGNLGSGNGNGNGAAQLVLIHSFHVMYLQVVALLHEQPTCRSICCLPMVHSVDSTWTPHRLNFRCLQAMAPLEQQDKAAVTTTVSHQHPCRLCLLPVPDAMHAAEPVSEKSHYIFSSQLRADQMPGPAREGWLMCTFFFSMRQ